MRAVVIAALLVASVMPMADAWWCTGHMTIAQIAKSVMDAQAVSNVNAIIGNLSAAGPFPQSPDMVQVACWADDLKSDGLYAMKSWHFINQVYDPTNFPATGHVQEENVESVITQMDTAAKRNRYSDAKQWILQFAVANMIHFYGDIHQPLHAAELFSAIYPNGDEGGNAEKVTVDGTSTNLHAIWDSICWEYNQELKRPLNPTDLQTIVTFANYLMQTYTFTAAQKAQFNSTIMAQESLAAAASTAYPGTSNGMTITSDYLAKCKPVAEGRVALAGYRLGTQLQYLFGSQFTTAEIATKAQRHVAELFVARRSSARGAYKARVARN